MASLNKIQLIGNLGRDPKIEDFGADKKKATFSMATSESYTSSRDQNVPQTEWHNIVLWSPQAEIAEKYLSKGKQVYIEGKIKHRSYEDNKGETRRITEVVGRRLILLGNRNDGTHTAQVDTTPEVAAPANSEEDGLPF